MEIVLRIILSFVIMAGATILAAAIAFVLALLFSGGPELTVAAVLLLVLAYVAWHVAGKILKDRQP